MHIYILIHLVLTTSPQFDRFTGKKFLLGGENVQHIPVSQNTAPVKSDIIQLKCQEMWYVHCITREWSTVLHRYETIIEGSVIISMFFSLSFYSQKCCYSTSRTRVFWIKPRRLLWIWPASLAEWRLEILSLQGMMGVLPVLYDVIFYITVITMVTYKIISVWYHWWCDSKNLRPGHILPQNLKKKYNDMIMVYCCFVV